MDIFTKCKEYRRAQDAIDGGYYIYFIPITGNDGPVVIMDGREMIMVGSNNYLGLTHEPRVLDAAIVATKKYGTSCSGSRFLNGTLDIHLELEERLARFMHREAALIFSTGFQTNLGAISAVANHRDIIIMDRLDHASIYAGVQGAVGSIVKRFQHNNMQDLENILSNLDPDKGKMIVSDGVFSMEGDLVHLEELTRLAKKYDARVYIDEAHGVGVLGENGRGACEYLGHEDGVDLVMSTFSKSFASLGGYVSGEKYVVDYIKHNASPLIFSASPTPAATASALKSLDIIEQEPERRQHLIDNGLYMRTELKRLGFDTGPDSIAPIVPIFVRDEKKTFAFWQGLFAAGVYSNAVVSPAVPPTDSLIRTSYMATHTRPQLDRCLQTMKDVAQKLEII